MAASGANISVGCSGHAVHIGEAPGQDAFDLNPIWTSSNGADGPSGPALAIAPPEWFMTIPIPDLGRAKATAKHLARLSPAVSHSAALEAVAHALRHKHWYELMHQPAALGPSPHDRATAKAVILDLAASLELGAGDVQYAVAKARLLGDSPWTRDEHLALRGDLWRARDFRDAARRGRGTVVHDKVEGRRRRRAYLKSTGRSTVLVNDEGTYHVADFEVSYPRRPLPDFVPTRLWIPYGVWTLADGSRIAHSRDYLPLWRVTDAGVERIEPWLWIGGIEHERWFFRDVGALDWLDRAAVARSLRWLDEHRIQALPRLVEVMIHLFEDKVDHITTAAGRLQAKAGSLALPAYASGLNHQLRY